MSRSVSRRSGRRSASTEARSASNLAGGNCATRSTLPRQRAANSAASRHSSGTRSRADSASAWRALRADTRAARSRVRGDGREIMRNERIAHGQPHLHASRPIERRQQPCTGCGHALPAARPRRGAEQSVHLRQQRAQRAAIAQHAEHSRRLRFQESLRQFLPDALGRQCGEFPRADDRAHQCHRLGRHRKIQARSETRDPQHPKRVFGKGG